MTNVLLSISCSIHPHFAHLLLFVSFAHSNFNLSDYFWTKQSKIVCVNFTLTFSFWVIYQNSKHASLPSNWLNSSICLWSFRRSTGLQMSTLLRKTNWMCRIGKKLKVKSREQNIARVVTFHRAACLLYFC